MRIYLWRETWMLRLFGLLKIPLVFWLRPFVIAVNDKQAILCIPLRRRTRNHVGSMYFGALASGADIVVGMHVMHFIKRFPEKITFVFKDAYIEFLKRPTANVHFICEDGEKIYAMLQRAIQSKARENIEVNVIATTPQISSNEPVARFKMTLSVKSKY